MRRWWTRRARRGASEWRCTLRREARRGSARLDQPAPTCPDLPARICSSNCPCLAHLDTHHCACNRLPPVPLASKQHVKMDRAPQPQSEAVFSCAKPILVVPGR